MFFYAAHPFSSTDHNGLKVESCVLNVANFIAQERRGGRCGLIYLMEMFTGNTQESKGSTCGN